MQNDRALAHAYRAAAARACENASRVDADSRRVLRNTRSTEPEWPCAVECPDGCGAQVWIAGNEQGLTILLDTLPVAPGNGGYVVEPLYVGPTADIADVKDGTEESTTREFVEQANAWNWYATYESTLVTSNNSRFAPHVTTCTRKTIRQRARALNGQTFGGCCKPKAERNASKKSRPTEGWLVDRATISAPNGQLFLFGTLYPQSQTRSGGQQTAAARVRRAGGSSARLSRAESRGRGCTTFAANSCMSRLSSKDPA